MRIKLLFIALLFSGLAYTQVPTCLWAKTAGGSGMDNGNSVATDTDGNVIVTGYFTSPAITFGASTLTNASNLGLADLFLVKYDPNGNVLWSRSAGGTPNDYANSVATDASGNIFISGYFSSPFITFGSTTLTNTVPGKSDVFLVKYDPAGNVLWARSGGGNDWDYGNSVATDASGSVVIAGYFASSLMSFGTVTLSISGVFDIYLVKYDAAGNVLWARREGGSANDYANGVAADNAGNILLTGYFDSPSISFGTTALTNAGDNDCFIAKYDAGGNALWAKSAGGGAFDKGNSVTADVNGNVLLSGFFVSSSITIGTTSLINAGTANLFLVKYDSGGNLLWVKREGGSASDEGYSISTDAGGNIIIAGVFTSPSINFGATTLTNAGVSDIFIVKYSPTGSILWAKRAGGNSGDEGNSVFTDAGGNIFVTGYFTSPSLTFDTTVLTNAGGLDFYLAKLSDVTITGIDANTTTNAIDVFPNPFSSQLILQTTLPLEDATLRVDNGMGQTIAQMENINGQKIIFNRGHLPGGLYFIRLTQGNKLFAVQKVIIAD